MIYRPWCIGIVFVGHQRCLHRCVRRSAGTSKAIPEVAFVHAAFRMMLFGLESLESTLLVFLQYCKGLSKALRGNGLLFEMPEDNVQ